MRSASLMQQLDLISDWVESTRAASLPEFYYRPPNAAQENEAWAPRARHISIIRLTLRGPEH
jgi:hypothetical protein